MLLHLRRQMAAQCDVVKVRDQSGNHLDGWMDGWMGSQDSPLAIINRSDTSLVSFMSYRVRRLICTRRVRIVTSRWLPFPVEPADNNPLLLTEDAVQ
jgi:hypothetical protein